MSQVSVLHSLLLKPEHSPLFHHGDEHLVKPEHSPLFHHGDEHLVKPEHSPLFHHGDEHLVISQSRFWILSFRLVSLLLRAYNLIYGVPCGCLMVFFLLIVFV